MLLNSGLISSTTIPVQPRRKRKRIRVKHYKSARRHFRHGRCAAVVRAITAARLYLKGEVPSLADAAEACGSNSHYVKAAITLIKSEDNALLNRVLAGHVGLLAAATEMKPRAKLLESYRAATTEDRVAFARAVGASDLFDNVVVPASA
jgi:hypothetical protein